MKSGKLVLIIFLLIGLACGIATTVAVIINRIEYRKSELIINEARKDMIIQEGYVRVLAENIQLKNYDDDAGLNKLKNILQQHEIAIKTINGSLIDHIKYFNDKWCSKIPYLSKRF